MTPPPLLPSLAYFAVDFTACLVVIKSYSMAQHSDNNKNSQKLKRPTIGWGSFLFCPLTK